MQIEPDMIVKNVVNGQFYRVRSVSNTKAVCHPCTRKGNKPGAGRNALAFEFELERLRIVRLAHQTTNN